MEKQSKVVKSLSFIKNIRLHGVECWQIQESKNYISGYLLGGGSKGDEVM